MSDFTPEQANANVVLDSISPTGIRLTTIEVTFWRPMLAEFNTHRVISRNSQSSRAKPVDQRLAQVLHDPVFPIVWPAEQKGMSGGAHLTGEALDDAQRLFRHLAEYTAQTIMDYIEAHPKEDRLHKSALNRLLEPFISHTVVATFTEFEGFFHQRDHHAAQPEIAIPTRLMREVTETSTPTPLDYGEWHLPYIRPEDITEVSDEWAGKRFGGTQMPHQTACLTILKEISTARCARTSFTPYPTPEEPAPKRSISADLGLYAKLTDRTEDPDDPVHWSPLEHVATPCIHCAPRKRVLQRPTSTFAKIITPNDMVFWVHEHPGNFRGWFQHRHELDSWPYASEES